MKKLFYNTWEFNNALSIFPKDPFECKKRFEDYLEKYPKDYLSQSYYTSVLIELGDFDKAEEILDYISKNASIDYNSFTMGDKLQSLKRNIFLNQLKILSFKEKYEELYNMCLNNMQYIKELNLEQLFFYVEKKYGIIKSDVAEYLPYSNRQILDYKESDFVEHIKKHLIDYNFDSDKTKCSMFVSNFPIEEVIEEIKKHIPSSKRLFTTLYDNTYIFKFNNCGRVNNKSVDFFKVITFHNTTDFITMYPNEYGENLPYVDLNYLIKEEDTPKIKRLSKTEKFNLRYNK